MGRTQGIFSILALSSVSHLAYAAEASEPTSSNEVVVPAAEPADEAVPPPPEPRAPRVLWVEPGRAPERPSTTSPREAEAPRPRRFRIGNARWLIGVDRASSFAGYRSTTDLPYGADVVTSGVEATIVGQVDQDALTPLVLPRLSLDRRWANGLSLGFVFSYAARSARQSSDGVRTALPSREAALFGPRIGWMKALSSNVAVWLRGGPTWALQASSGPTTEPGELRTHTDQHWAISLEPQLVIMPWRHFGLSLGAAVDLGFDGERKTSISGGPDPYFGRNYETVSTFGVTAGLLALF